MRRLAWVPLLALAACSSPPAPKTPALDPAVETDFLARQVVALTEQDRWWRNLGAAPLDSIVTEALIANHDLQIASANVAAARAAATVAGADRWPQINASGNASRSERAIIGLPLPGGGVIQSLSSSTSASLDASWEVDLWNRLGLRQRAALADAQASAADLHAARLSITGQVVRAWLDLTESELQLALAQRTRTAFEQTAETARLRYERGLIPSVDVHLTRASAENAAALVALRETQREGASRRLEILMGRYPAARIHGGDALPSLLGKVPNGLPADLLLRRPDLVALERRYVASQARTGEARRNLLPRIALTGSKGLTSDELGDLLDGNFSVWSVAGSLLQPVFQGGRLRAVVSQNVAAEDVALARWTQRALTAMSEVETALSNEGWLAERELHLRAAVDAATSASALAESRYRQGLGDLLSVLEAQRRALDSESQWLTLRNAQLRARVDLHLALGGGFDVSDLSQTSGQGSK